MFTILEKEKALLSFVDFLKVFDRVRKSKGFGKQMNKEGSYHYVNISMEYCRDMTVVRTKQNMSRHYV